jgi:hypothetical protein
VKFIEVLNNARDSCIVASMSQTPTSRSIEMLTPSSISCVVKNSKEVVGITALSKQMWSSSPSYQTTFSS